MNWREWIIEKLGGYTDVDSALESITDSTERNYILTRAVKRLYNTISSEDILKENEYGQWMFMGRTLSKAEVAQIKAEATHFLGTMLWKVLQADVKYQANRKMYLLAQSDTDLTAGKLWTLTLDAFKTRLQSMMKGKGTFSE